MPRGAPNKTTYHGIAVSKGADGRYHAKVTVAKRGDGTYDRRNVRHNDLGVVKDRIDKLLDSKARREVRRPGPSPTVAEWLEYWFSEIAIGGRRPLAPRTIDDYRSKARCWINPHIGGIRLDDLEPEDLDDLYNRMRRAGKAESHVRKVHAILSRGLDLAVKRRRAHQNVTKLVDAPEVGGAGATPMDEQIVQRVLAIAAARRNGLRWLLGVATGGRQGEVLGLTWQAVDLEAGAVQLDWQLQRLTWRHGCADPYACGKDHHRTRRCPTDNRGICLRHRVVDSSGAVRPAARGCPPRCDKNCAKHGAYCPQRQGGGLVMRRPKTWRPGRSHVVGIPPELVAALRKHSTAQKRERLIAGTAWRRMSLPDGERVDLVFARYDGTPMDPRQDWGELQEMLLEAGAPPDRVHALRHTAGTLMAADGIGMEKIAEALGHTDIRTTRRYVGVRTEGTRAATAAVMGRLIGTSVPQRVPQRRSSGMGGDDRK